MTAEKILNTTWYCPYNDKYNSLQLFFVDKKNKIENVNKNTFYGNLKFLDETGQFEEDSYQGECELTYDYKFYEYVPFETHNEWVTFGRKDKPTKLAIFKALKQYRLKAVYNFNEQTTIKEVKERLLIPCMDKILNHKNTLATLFFLNRLTPDSISFEVFLFCDEELPETELDDIMASSAQTAFNCHLLDPQNSTYWFYRFYCEVFLNSNVLTGSSSIFSFSCKPLEVVCEKIFNIGGLNFSITDGRLLADLFDKILTTDFFYFWSHAVSRAYRNYFQFHKGKVVANFFPLPLPTSCIALVKYLGVNNKTNLTKMTAEKILNLSWCSYNNKYNSELFLAYEKDKLDGCNNSYSTLYPFSEYYKENKKIGNAKGTLYDNLKFLDETGQLEENSYQRECELTYDYKFYDYVPFEIHKEWSAYPEWEDKPTKLAIFKALKQYRLKAVYNFNEQTTIKEAKERLLIPCMDKILNHKNTLATLFFLNRLTPDSISFEVFLFCDEELPETELDDIMANPAQTAFNCHLLDPQNSTYWFYRFYCEVFLNSNVLTGSSSIFSFSCNQPLEVVCEKFFNIGGLNFSITDGGIFTSIFDWTLTNDFFDWMFTTADEYNLYRVRQKFDLNHYVHPLPGPGRCIALSKSIWWEDPPTPPVKPFVFEPC